jgi:3-oxoacyl-[acyl-carrier protein] reductase
MELGLRGKRALVTAASRGLGRAVAESLLAEGCRVCVTSSSEPSIEAAAREMANAGGEVHALAADLGRDDECDRLFAWATSTLGGLDILVNNTVGPPTGGVLEVSDDQWRESFDLIFMSALRLSRAAIPVMWEGGGGSIVNLASLTAKQPIDGIALSNALRPALVGMAKTLSRGAAPEVRVNNIATEHILTDRIRDIAERIWRQGDESVDDTLWRMALTVPLGRLRDTAGARQRGRVPGERCGQLHHRGDARGGWRARSRALLTGRERGEWFTPTRRSLM